MRGVDLWSTWDKIQCRRWCFAARNRLLLAETAEEMSRRGPRREWSKSKMSATRQLYGPGTIGVIRIFWTSSIDARLLPAQVSDDKVRVAVIIG